MKWSFTEGLETNSVGFTLLFGNKREAAKKREQIPRDMHNLQRKFDVSGLVL